MAVAESDLLVAFTATEESTPGRCPGAACQQAVCELAPPTGELLQGFARTVRVGRENLVRAVVRLRESLRRVRVAAGCSLCARRVFACMRQCACDAAILRACDLCLRSARAGLAPHVCPYAGYPSMSCIGS